MSQTPQEQVLRFNSSSGSLFPQDRTPLRLRQSQDLRLPSIEEAYQLLNTVLLYLCGTQHYFDERRLSDQIMILYRNNFDDDQRTNIWFLQILLVFAIGKLLRGDLDGTSDPPGFVLFNEVLNLLPGISEIRAHGVTGIEILALVAVYYQNIDCKDDAATHV